MKRTSLRSILAPMPGKAHLLRVDLKINKPNKTSRSVRWTHPKKSGWGIVNTFN